MVSLPMYFPSQFDREAAIVCADLVGMAYDMYQQWLDQRKPKQEKFHWKPDCPPSGLELKYSAPIWATEKFWEIFHHPLISYSEPFAFVARAENGTAYLAFRGTDSVEDWVENLELAQEHYNLVANYGKVHRGFYSLYYSMHAAILTELTRSNLPQQLYVTGHSLGSALSTLAVPHLLSIPEFQANKIALKHYNFASPHVGNSAFASAYNQNGVLTYRIVNTSDLVPDIPLSAVGRLLYQHVGTPVDFTAQYNSVPGNHNWKSAYRYALEHCNLPQGPV